MSRRKSWFGDEWEQAEIPASLQEERWSRVTEYHRHKGGLGDGFRTDWSGKIGYSVRRLTPIRDSEPWNRLGKIGGMYDLTRDYGTSWDRRSEAILYARLMLAQQKLSEKIVTDEGRALAAEVLARLVEMSAGAQTRYGEWFKAQLIAKVKSLDLGGYIYHSLGTIGRRSDDDYLTFTPYSPAAYAQTIEDARWLLIPKQPTSHPRLGHGLTVECERHATRLDEVLADLWVAGFELVPGVANASQKLVMQDFLWGCLNLGHRATIAPHGLWPVRPEALRSLSRDPAFSASQLGSVQGKPAVTEQQRDEAVLRWLNHHDEAPDVGATLHEADYIYDARSYANFAASNPTTTPALDEAQVAAALHKLGVTWAPSKAPQRVLSNLRPKLARWMVEWGMEAAPVGASPMSYGQVLEHYQAWRAKVIERKRSERHYTFPPDLTGDPDRLYYGLQLLGAKMSPKGDGMLVQRIKGFRVGKVGEIFGVELPDLTAPLPSIAALPSNKPRSSEPQDDDERLSPEVMAELRASLNVSPPLDQSRMSLWCLSHARQRFLERRLWQMLDAWNESTQESEGQRVERRVSKLKLARRALERFLVAWHTQALPPSEAHAFYPPSRFGSGFFSADFYLPKPVYSNQLRRDFERMMEMERAYRQSLDEMFRKALAHKPQLTLQDELEAALRRQLALHLAEGILDRDMGQDAAQAVLVSLGHSAQEARALAHDANDRSNLYRATDALRDARKAIPRTPKEDLAGRIIDLRSAHKPYQREHALWWLHTFALQHLPDTYKANLPTLTQADEQADALDTPQTDASLMELPSQAESQADNQAEDATSATEEAEAIFQSVVEAVAQQRDRQRTERVARGLAARLVPRIEQVLVQLRAKVSA
jgi:hypothetical protein